MKNYKNELELWELCIFADNDFLPFYQKVRSYIKQKCEKSVVAFDEVENTFLFAVVPKYAEQIAGLITNEICLYLLQKKKSEYLCNHLINTSFMGDLELIFIKTLTLFDNENDCLEIQKNLRLNKELHLNEFYFFKCKNLRKRWQEICNMTNENNFFFSSNELTLKLIRFLLNNCKRKVDKLIISKNKSYIYISNKNDIISFFSIDEDSVNRGNNIVIKILENLPNNIVLENEKNFNKEFVTFLDLIFKNSLKFAV